MTQEETSWAQPRPNPKPALPFTGFTEASKVLRELPVGSNKITFHVKDEKQADAIATILSTCFAKGDHEIMVGGGYKEIMANTFSPRSDSEIEDLPKNHFGFSWDARSGIATLTPKRPVSFVDKTNVETILEYQLVNQLGTFCNPPRMVNTANGECGAFAFDPDTAVALTGILKKVLAANNMSPDAITLAKDYREPGMDILVPTELVSLFCSMGQDSKGKDSGAMSYLC